MYVLKFEKAIYLKIIWHNRKKIVNLFSILNEINIWRYKWLEDVNSQASVQ